MLTFQLTSDNQASCDGHAVKHRTPVLALCRLLEKMAYPDDDVLVMRGHVPCLSGRLHKMAKLSVREEPTLHLAKYEEFEGIGNN